MKRLIFIMALILPAISMFCIEVGGHITQDTVWSPDNNPYVITSFLYIDAGVTLTIMPGTSIRCTGADKSSIYNFMWTGNTQPVSKMIIVNGSINAVGTARMPITFDKYQPDSDFRWGGIYISPNAPISTFEFCEIKNTFFCDYMPGEWSLSAIGFANGVLNIRNCLFDNNYVALGTGNLRMDLVVYNCQFLSFNDSYPTPFAGATAITIGASGPSDSGENYLLTIAKSYFSGNSLFVYNFEYTDVLYLNNVLYNFGARDERTETPGTTNSSRSSYGNVSINGSRGWGCYSATAEDTVYARRNKMIKPVNANPSNRPLLLSSGGFGTNFVSDNYMYGCVQAKTTTANANATYMYNNFIEDNYGGATLDFDNSNPAFTGGQMRFYNNLLRFVGDYSYPQLATIRHASPYFYNNTLVGYRILFNAIGDCDVVFENNIIPCSQWSSGSISPDHHPMLYNNCLSFPILPPWNNIDGGDNIVANPMFADTLNADYSLSAGSPCIDAGAFRPDLPDFDIIYHKRIVPGVAGAQQTIDIGAYEYNSVYIGGLRGIVFDPDNGEMIDCVKIEINQKLPEFSDSLGYFEYPTGPGVYTIRASRWDYEDQVIENISVTEGEQALVAIPMYRINTAANDPAAPAVLTKTLRNYPNPFNPHTTISFVTSQPGNVMLKVYNMKGQLVKTLHDGFLNRGYQSIQWNGTDEKGSSVGSGVYFVRVLVNGEGETHKMVMVK